MNCFLSDIVKFYDPKMHYSNFSPAFRKKELCGQLKLELKFTRNEAIVRSNFEDKRSQDAFSPSFPNRPKRLPHQIGTEISGRTTE
jgi:hypothetical protein